MTKHAAILRDLDELGQMTFQRHQAGEPLAPIEEWPDIEREGAAGHLSWSGRRDNPTAGGSRLLDSPEQIDELPRGMDALEKRTGLKYPTKRFAEYIDPADDTQWWMTYDYQRHRSSKVWYEPDDSGVYPDEFYRNGRLTTNVPENVYRALCEAADEREREV